MNEERLRILQMVQNQTINAAEGAKLLAALGGENAQLAPLSSSNAARPRWFRVRVSDRATGRVKVNINMPLSLVDFGLRMGGVTGVDVEELRATLHQAEGGKIVDVLDDKDDEHVEIFVE